MKIRILNTVLFSLGMAAAAAHAADTEPNDALAGPSPAVSLTRAIAAAETHVGGTARRAEYERSAQGWRYDVEVARGAQVFDVAVDARDGTVMHAVADKIERDDGADPAD